MPVLSPPARRQFVSILRISGPLIVNNLAVAGMNFADTVMSGRLGADALAAVAVGANTWLLAFSACLGLLMAIWGSTRGVAHRARRVAADQRTVETPGGGEAFRRALGPPRVIGTG